MYPSPGVIPFAPAQSYPMVAAGPRVSVHYPHVMPGAPRFPQLGCVGCALGATTTTSAAAGNTVAVVGFGVLGLVAAFLAYRRIKG